MKQLMLIVIPLLLLTPALTWATNESSYKLGYDSASIIFTCISHDDKVPSESACDRQTPYSFNQYDTCGYRYSPPSHEDILTLSNMTACTDGYADGFTHWCVKNLALCEIQVRANTIPHIIQKHETECGPVDPRNNTSICRDVGTDAIHLF